MGLVSVATMGAWKFLALLGYAALYAYVAPWHLSPTQWYTWVIAIVGVDILFYAYHRIAHRVRLIWATHQAHHSSRYFNFATALRQKWNNSGEIIIWIPLPLLGVPPWMVFTGFSINLIYQFWVHTERIDKLPRAYEFVFNTPSHHRVHHGMDPEYLDKNYGGIFILWDRLFGTFQPELFRPHYGLTKPVNTFNIWKLQTREYVAIAHDVRAATRWRDRLGYVFGPPGWAPTVAAAIHYGCHTLSLTSVPSSRMEPMEVKEVLLPGVGLRYEFDNADGNRIGVIARRSGDFEVVVYGAADPDQARPVFRLTDEEAEALAQILGAPRLVERFADLTKEVPGPGRRPGGDRGDLAVRRIARWATPRPGPAPARPSWRSCATRRCWPRRVPTRCCTPTTSSW